MGRKLRKIFVVVVVAFLIEITVFQAQAIYTRIKFGEDANFVYHLEDMQALNWIQAPEGGLVSQPDPVLLISQVNKTVGTMQIVFKTEPAVTSITCFYQNDVTLKAGTLESIQTSVEEGKPVQIKINDKVDELRVDLGEEANVKLDSIELTLNPTKFDISISRIVACLFIFFVGKFLFSLQKMPDYYSVKQVSSGEERH